MAGIVSYGAYVPQYRIESREIARLWGEDGDAVAAGLNIERKSVPDEDEDTASISVEAARNALHGTDVDGCA